MKRFMMRSARDDFEAFLIAGAMESAGASVFSVTYDGQHTQSGALQPCSKFLVWCKVKDDAHIRRIDKAIDKVRI